MGRLGRLCGQVKEILRPNVRVMRGMTSEHESVAGGALTGVAKSTVTN
jgi:hypothetical protein